MLPRKDGALEFRSFVFWLRIIIAARSGSPANGIRALWNKIGNSFQPSRGLPTRPATGLVPSVATTVRRGTFRRCDRGLIRPSGFIVAEQLKAHTTTARNPRRVAAPTRNRQSNSADAAPDAREHRCEQRQHKPPYNSSDPFRWRRLTYVRLSHQSQSS
jgi:hypothetical protein